MSDIAKRAAENIDSISPNFRANPLYVEEFIAQAIADATAELRAAFVRAIIGDDDMTTKVAKYVSNPIHAAEYLAAERATNREDMAELTRTIANQRNEITRLLAAAELARGNEAFLTKDAMESRAKLAATENLRTENEQLRRILQRAVDGLRRVETMQGMIEWYDDAVAALTKATGNQ